MTARVWPAIPGALLIAELTDHVGLTEGLSAAMTHTRQRRSAHDPGVVLAHLAVSLANSGDCLADIAVLRNQAEAVREGHVGPYRVPGARLDSQ